MDKESGIEQRMQRFLESQAHVTPLDGHVPQPPGVKIADYLFFDRQAVVEMKTLDIDPKNKILEGAKPIMESPEFPLIFGAYDLEAAIKCTPGGESHLFNIFSRATRMIEGVLRNAKRQIASSKKLLGLDPDTPGVALVLNESVESIPISQLVDRFSFRLTGDGKEPARFSEIDFVILVQTTYRLRNTDAPVVPTFVISNDFNAHRHHLIEKGIGEFLRDWAFSQGHNYVQTNDPTRLRFEHVQKPALLPKSLQDVVELAYRRRRYMQYWNDHELITHGKRVVENMLSIVLIGRPKPSEANAMLYMKHFAELLEECRIRSFDFKRIMSQIPRGE